MAGPCCRCQGQGADMPKLIAVDFDGVFHQYQDWKGADVIDGLPVPGAIEWLTSLLNDPRFEVAISSSRNHQSGGVQAMAKWLLDNGLVPMLLDKVRFPIHKPAAFLSIDDRGWQFDGSFPSADVIDSFQPWWRR